MALPSTYGTDIYVCDYCEESWRDTAGLESSPCPECGRVTARAGWPGGSTRAVLYHDQTGAHVHQEDPCPTSASSSQTSSSSP